MDGKICRLCLQTISKNYQIVGGSLLKSLKTLKLNLNLSQENVMCTECANYFQVFSNFKIASFYMSNTENDVSLDPIIIHDLNSLNTEIKCSFCTKTGGREDFIALNETEKCESLVNMLKQHILEMNLNNIEELLTCKICLDALQGVLSFISKCLEVEEKISKYIKIEGTNDKGEIELKDVQKFTLKSAVKCEIDPIDVIEFGNRFDQIKKECTMTVKSEIKHENDISNPELTIKPEYVNTNIEQNHDGNQHPMDNIGGDPLELVTSETERKYMEQHLWTHESSSTINMFKCEMCPYETNYTSNFKRHLVTHKSTSEINMFKCEMCSYRTKFKNYLKKHLLSHKSSSELHMFQCEMCSYETKDKSNLKKHSLTHKSPSEIDMFMCEVCSYGTKYKRSIEAHLLTHKSPSERNTFKCAICLYETKHKRHLRKHIWIHKGLSEISKFKCATCTYETPHKYNLRRHLVTHESSSAINSFKCEICLYKTKHKRLLKQHLLSHKGVCVKTDVSKMP